MANPVSLSNLQQQKSTRKSDGTVTETWTVPDALSVTGDTTLNGKCSIADQLSGAGVVTFATSAPTPQGAGVFWYDTTNNRLWVYDGSSWNTVTQNLALLHLGNPGGGSGVTWLYGPGLVLLQGSADDGYAMTGIPYGGRVLGMSVSCEILSYTSGTPDITIIHRDGGASETDLITENLSGTSGTGKYEWGFNYARDAYEFDADTFFGANVDGNGNLSMFDTVVNLLLDLDGVPAQ